MWYTRVKTLYEQQRASDRLLPHSSNSLPHTGPSPRKKTALDLKSHRSYDACSVQMTLETFKLGLKHSELKYCHFTPVKQEQTFSGRMSYNFSAFDIVPKADALHFASMLGLPRLIQLLILEDYDMNSKQSVGCSLHCAMLGMQTSMQTGIEAQRYHTS